MPYICIDNMRLVKVYVRLIKSSLVFVLVECGQLAALFFLQLSERQPHYISAGNDVTGWWQGMISKNKNNCPRYDSSSGLPMLTCRASGNRIFRNHG